MLIKNKTEQARSCDGKIARPWRIIEVSDNAVIDESVFKILGEKEESKKIKINKIKEGEN